MTARFREIVAHGCLAALIAASALVWSFSFLSFHDAKMLALWLGLIAFIAVQRRFYPDPFVGFSAWLPAWIGIAVGGMGAMFWARVPWLSVDALLRSTGLLLVGSLAYGITRSPQGRRVVFSSIVSSAFVVGLLALAQEAGCLRDLFPVFSHYDQSMYSVFGNEGLLGGYMALGLVLLPGALGVELFSLSKRHFVVGGIAAVVMLATLLLSASRAGEFSLLVGMLVWFFFMQRGFKQCKTLTILSSLVFVGLVLVLGERSVEKWLTITTGGDVGIQARLWIWRASSSMLLDHPLWGVGLGNFSYWISSYLGAGGMGYHNSVTTYHAHFDLLELGCEAGGLGLLFLVWLLSRYRLRSTCACSGAVALAVFSCLYPAWASVPHALAAVLLVTMNLDGRCASSPSTAFPQRGSAVWGIIATLVVLCAVLHAVLVLRPSFMLRRAEDLHLAGKDAGEAYQAALTGGGFRGEAHEAYGIYLLERGDNEDALHEFTAAKSELDTGRLYLLLTRTATALGQHELAQKYKEEGLLRWPWAEEEFDIPRSRKQVDCP